MDVFIRGQRSQRARCALCHDRFAEGDSGPLDCPGCGACNHADCLSELQRCPTLGCDYALDGRRDEVRRVARPRRRARLRRDLRQTAAILAVVLAAFGPWAGLEQGHLPALPLLALSLAAWGTILWWVDAQLKGGSRRSSQRRPRP